MSNSFKSMFFCAIICVASCASEESITLSNECNGDFDCPKSHFCSLDQMCIQRDESTTNVYFIDQSKPMQETDNRLDFCDGVDNDEDGQTDENDPNLMRPCTTLIVYEGNLVHVQGYIACSSNGLVCAPPQIEICQLNAEICYNGLDDNCNGFENEGCNGNAVRDSEPVDWCNGIDDDNDGETDEDDPNIGLICTAVLNMNNHDTPIMGSLICENGELLCSTPPLEQCQLQAEICGDIYDNNCNGYVNEDCGQTTVPADCDDNDPCTHDIPTTDGVYTWCTHIMICDQDGDGQGHNQNGWPDCDDNDPSVGLLFPELCDGKDNNCNGQVDEFCDGLPLGADCSTDFQCESGHCSGPEGILVGTCSIECGPLTNYAECPEGSNCFWTFDDNLSGGPEFDKWSCLPSADGATPLCDGIDNDEDGLIDEGCLDVQCEEKFHIEFSVNTPSGIFSPSPQMLVAILRVTNYTEDDLLLSVLTVKVGVINNYPDHDMENWIVKDFHGNELSTNKIDIRGSDTHNEIYFHFNPPLEIPENSFANNDKRLFIYTDTTEMTALNDTIQLWMTTACGEELFGGMLTH